MHTVCIYSICSAKADTCETKDAIGRGWTQNSDPHKKQSFLCFNQGEEEEEEQENKEEDEEKEDVKEEQ